MGISISIPPIPYIPSDLRVVGSHIDMNAHDSSDILIPKEKWESEIRRITPGYTKQGCKDSYELWRKALVNATVYDQRTLDNLDYAKNNFVACSVRLVIDS